MIGDVLAAEGGSGVKPGIILRRTVILRRNVGLWVGISLRYRVRLRCRIRLLCGIGLRQVRGGQHQLELPGLVIALTQFKVIGAGRDVPSVICAVPDKLVSAFRLYFRHQFGHGLSVAVQQPQDGHAAFVKNIPDSLFLTRLNGDIGDRK